MKKETFRVLIISWSIIMGLIIIYLFLELIRITTDTNKLIRRIFYPII